MKIFHFAILTAYAMGTGAYAEATKVPPVLENSTYSNALTPPSLPSQEPVPAFVANNEDSNTLGKIQADVVELKRKVQAQEETISALKAANLELQKKLNSTNKSAVAAAPASAPTKAPVLEESSAPKAAPKVEASNSGSEKERYQRGTDFLKNGDNNQALQEFQDLIKTYPKGDYADNAQYWTGVALLNKGDKNAAIQAFDKVARVYPKSEKAPEALFKLGDTLLSVKNKTKAKEYFDYVIENYPGTNGATLATKKKAQAKL